MKRAYIICAALMCASPVLADTAKVFGNANAKVLHVEQNKNVQAKGALPPIADLGPLLPRVNGPLSPMINGPLAPMAMPALMPRL